MTVNATGSTWSAPPPGRSEPAPLSSTAGRIIAWRTQKGGGRQDPRHDHLGATMASTVAACLLVDFDPQGALSVGLGVPAHQLDRTIHNLLIGNEPGRRGDHPDQGGRMDLLPSNIDLSAAEVQLVTEVVGSRRWAAPSARFATSTT